jgi:hypothetical protein
LEFFAEKCLSNHPDFLLIGQACRAAQPPPIFGLVRATLYHGDTIETGVWGPSQQKEILLLVKMKEKKYSRYNRYQKCCLRKL